MNLKLDLPIVLLALICSCWGCEKEVPVHFPVIYGHAGTTLADERAVYPPNSEASILYALNALNADGVEVDVQLTLDSFLVIYHDPYLDSRTNITGCVNSTTYSELLTAKYYGDLTLLNLTRVLELTINRGKKVVLDIKPYNFCTEQSIDFEQFNWRLNNAIQAYSSEQRGLITVNCRKFELLFALEDSSIIRCFESENIEQGINYCENFGIDKLMIKSSIFTNEMMQKLKQKNIRYCISDIKTKQEISWAASFSPDEVITDNIAATRKHYK
jgi:glycerophosphoryl diester phosphodiesterase